MKTTPFPLVLLGCCALAITPSQGTTLFSDSFAYAAGALSGDGPPAGAPPGQTGWISNSGNPQVAGPGLRFAGVTSAGNTATITGVTGANGDVVTADMGNVSSGVVWLGFLVRETAGTATPNGFDIVFLGGAGGGPSFGLVYNTNRYGIDNNTGLAGSQATTTTGPSRMTVWLVVKLDFNAGMEFLYINPTKTSQPSAQLPMTASFKASGFNSVVLAGGFNTATFDFDEVRIGTSLNDVRQ